MNAVNRPFKFRVWNHEKKQFSDSNEMLCFPVDGKRPKPFDECIAFTIQQYTGINDRDNVEIFEGDIVSVGHYFNVNYLCPIVFNEGGFSYVLPNTFFCRYFNSFFEQIKNSVVVGNIFENPELL